MRVAGKKWGISVQMCLLGYKAAGSCCDHASDSSRGLKEASKDAQKTCSLSKTPRTYLGVSQPSGDRCR